MKILLTHMYSETHQTGYLFPVQKIQQHPHVPTQINQCLLLYVDDVISRIGRMFPDMSIELFRPNGTSAVLLISGTFSENRQVLRHEVTEGSELQKVPFVFSQPKAAPLSSSVLDRKDSTERKVDEVAMVVMPELAVLR
ncbi:mediator of RNA polymerase II transcription subunit 27 isoform X1 [Tachysurus ichikawai]